MVIYRSILYCDYFFLQKWTVELCKTDSDGDGRTNGVELCDSNCEWPENNLDPDCIVSHPGINDDDKCPE